MQIKKKYIVLPIIFLALFSGEISGQATKIKSSEAYDILVDSDDQYVSALHSIKKNKGEILYNIPEIHLIQADLSSKGYKDIVHNVTSSDNIMKSNDTEKTKVTNNNIKISEDKFPFWDVQWDMKKITNNGEDYKFIIPNDRVTVGLVDSGVDVNHPSLKSSILKNGSENLVPKGGRNQSDTTETGNPNDISDKLGHGTEVAGQITSDLNVRGSFPGVKMHVYRALGTTTSNPYWIMKGIIASADQNDAVINVSLGKYLLSNKDQNNSIEYKSWKKAISYAYRKGSIIVASSGEDGLNEDDQNSILKHYMKLQNLQKASGTVYDTPAQLKNVVSVGSTGPDDTVSDFSNYGNKIEFYAPGGDTSLYAKYGPQKWNELDLNDSQLVATTAIDGGYTYAYGTSFSAPKVTGAIASFIAKYQWYDKPHQVTKYIQKVTHRNKQGLRIINENFLQKKP
ncbi:S8 family serine peptidase [Pediococcus acidilactici]|uniref:S8 family serine peptidase n=1 Tax=Pediococcus acidilactici TaxID=1254 RepID=UPI0026F9E59F|nr:S8 family serine peptidase [Pediococcus acidilactici]MDO7803153.1 S8 family serine peptidase [Pediococcus acidilactici]